MIAILDTGGNISSVLHAFRRLGHEAEVTDEPGRADAIVIPGQGRADRVLHAVPYGMAWEHRPVLGICAGFHVLCRSSEEDMPIGIGVFDLDVVRQEPRRGWADTEFGCMYFCHDYGAGVDHAVKDNFTGVQFHPEKSQDAGLAFLDRWVRA